MWNAIILVQDLNSSRRVHFLRQLPLHHGHLQLVVVIIIFCYFCIFLESCNCWIFAVFKVGKSSSLIFFGFREFVYVSSCVKVLMHRHLFSSILVNSFEFLPRSFYERPRVSNNEGWPGVYPLMKFLLQRSFFCYSSGVPFSHVFFHLFLFDSVYFQYFCPVSRGNRIHPLHLCRGVRPLPTNVLNNLMMRYQ